MLVTATERRDTNSNLNRLLQVYVFIASLAGMKPLRMPVATASRKGISGVVTAADEQRVVLTSHGRPVAVVDSAERLDESARLIREASLAVLDAAADLVSARGKKFSLDEVCTRVGVDAGRVRELAAERSATGR